MRTLLGCVRNNVFHYGHHNGEEYCVYTISSGDGGSRIMLSLVAADSAAVHCKTVAASEGGRRRKSAYNNYDSATLCRRCVAFSNVGESVVRVGLYGEEPCTYLYVICSLTVTWLEFLSCFDARN